MGDATIPSKDALTERASARVGFILFSFATPTITGIQAKETCPVLAIMVNSQVESGAVMTNNRG